MATLSSNLSAILSAKNDIKSALIEKGVDMSNVAFPQYAQKIRDIQAGGGDIDALIDKTISVASFNTNIIGEYAFAACSALTTASFPKCTSIGSDAFGFCFALTTASFPKCTTIGSGAFAACFALTTANFPECTSIGSDAFGFCSALTTASFPKCTTIGSGAFAACSALTSLYLLGSSVCSLAASAAFSSTPIAGYTAFTNGVYGSIYVPASLLTTYRSKTNWTYFSSRFVGLTDAEIAQLDNQ